MIKIENIKTYGWEAAIRGARNPMNSWDKSDTLFIPRHELSEGSKYENLKQLCDGDIPIIGNNDLTLLKKLSKAGTDHRKYLRMIGVTMDIVAPLYWVAEHDTYKVSTVRNSCSFMHKGLSTPFSINDFNVNETIRYLINPIEKKYDEYILPYETNEFKIYKCQNGREYEVYRNGKVVILPFEYTDTMGRKRIFERKEVKPSLTKYGYYELNLGGREREKWMLHQLVATVWIDNPNGYKTVDHINSNKGDNSVENLQWMSLENNIRKAFDDGIYKQNLLHWNYSKYKNNLKIEPYIRLQIRNRWEKGENYKELAKEYGYTPAQVNNILTYKRDVNNFWFDFAYNWERTIEYLNQLRDEYLETKDDGIFIQIRDLLPQGYLCKYTWSANYEVLANIYKSRKHHRLIEWNDFCDIIRTLPYSELFTMEEL